MDLEEEIDRLYGMPLDEFVARRDEVAKTLRREGDREPAERVRALRKPTAGAWALNQAVRRRRRETDALLAAGERLRAAHEALLSGGEPAELREAMAEERELAAELATCAEAIASETGKSGPALRERVRSTLHAAALDEDVREALRRGRLVREQEAVGLGGFGGAPATAPPVKRGGRGRAAPARRGRRGRTTTAADAEQAERERAEALAAAEREHAEALANAERALEEARAANEEAQGAHGQSVEELEAARAALREAELTEREVRKRARETEREVARRERAADRLRHT
jgi:hypothetical protein